MPSGLKRLYHSSKFWLAMLAFGQSVLFYFVPDFPEQIWMSFDGLIAVVIASIAAEDFAAKLNR